MIREIIFKEDLPVEGEAYKVGEVSGRYFFTWGWKYPYLEDVSELPNYNIIDGENGIQWYETEKEALQACLNAVEATFLTFEVENAKEFLEELRHLT